MSQKKYLDLVGLTAYDRKLKEWFKAGVVDITDDAVRALFVTSVELPPDNEIWYTSSDGNIVVPQYLSNFGAGFVENVYEDGKGILRFNEPVTKIPYSSNSRVAAEYYGAFYKCSNLTSIIIPNNVTTIESQAFYGCSSLTSIIIPNSVTSIGGWAFEFCSGLTTIIYEGTQEQWNTITKGGEWNYKVPATYVQCTDGQVSL